MAYYYKSIKFCEATTLINFIRNNAKRIKSESINGNIIPVTYRGMNIPLKKGLDY